MSIRQWTNLVATDDERYKQFICPRHPPIARPSYPLEFPPELLIDIYIGIASDYMFLLFSSEIQDDEDVEARLAANPFLAFLRVSHQFRELAIKVSESSFGLRRNQDGRYVFVLIHRRFRWRVLTPLLGPAACHRTPGRACAMSANTRTCCSAALGKPSKSTKSKKVATWFRPY